MGRGYSIACAAAAVFAVAAPGAQAQQSPPKAAETQAEASNQREEIFRIVDAYVVSHLQEGLGLTDEQYATAVPLVARLQAERRQYLVARGRVLREMRRMLRAGGSSEQQVVEKLNELKQIEEQGPARIKNRSAALDAALSGVQQAKFRLLELDVEQRMRELLSRLRPATGRANRQP